MSQPIAIITSGEVVERILSHLNLPATPWGLVGRSRGTWATNGRLGVGDGARATRDADAPQRGPPYDQGVVPPTPDC
ncbi:MAG: hypothetical protein MUF54_12855 [Polyangiaceae bacterium]|nr:hypothetical protein [Polyangiaceae bacterium]